MTSSDLGTMVGKGFGKFVREVGIPFACLLVIVYFVMSDKTEEREARAAFQATQSKTYEAQAEAMRSISTAFAKVSEDLDDIKKLNGDHVAAIKQNNDSIDRLTDSIERRRLREIESEKASTLE